MTGVRETGSLVLAALLHWGVMGQVLNCSSCYCESQVTNKQTAAFKIFVDATFGSCELASEACYLVTSLLPVPVSCLELLWRGTVHAAGACRERDGWRGGKQRDAIVVE